MSPPVKHIVLLGDGMADRPIPELDGRTPLMAAATPNMDRIAANGVLGTVRTIPDGMALGSDVANLSVLGYDPAAVYTGRSPIEAAGMGVALGPADVAFRCNLVTLAKKGGAGRLDTRISGAVTPDLVMKDFAAGHPSDEEAIAVVRDLERELGGDGIEFFPGVSYRHLMVWRDGLDDMEVAPPHDLTDKRLAEGWFEGKASGKVLGLMERAVSLLADHPVNAARLAAGRDPVNAIWLWGQGFRPKMAPFRETYGLAGAMITAVDLLRGLAACIGFEVIDVPGATGYLDTDYEGKAAAALEALERVDIVYLHVEAPDEAGHGGKLAEKLMALEDFDSRIVGPVLKGLEKLGPHRVLLTPDHATPLEIKTHSGEPVPFAVLDPARSAGSGRAYDEENAAATGLHIESGHELMGRFVRGEF
ncbi:MAG: cofactor-independent phosphoglycerate mutase [bacterium]|nr:cofactor-independent phosphoglycerate mutase [bacterium]